MTKRIHDPSTRLKLQNLVNNEFTSSKMTARQFADYAARHLGVDVPTSCIEAIRIAFKIPSNNPKGNPKGAGLYARITALEARLSKLENMIAQECKQ